MLPTQHQLTFLSGQQATESLDISRYSMGDVYVPATFDNADIGIYKSYDNTNFYLAYDENGAILRCKKDATTGVPRSSVCFLPADVFPAFYIKLALLTPGAETLFAGGAGANRVMNVTFKA